MQYAHINIFIDENIGYLTISITFVHGRPNHKVAE